MTTPQTLSGSARTASASRYLQQLCKHWSHKADCTFDAESGQIHFDNGNSVSMTAADQSLEIIASVSPDGDLEHWADVIEKHLVRFAFREELVVTWGNPAE
jgi:hypothetical protein